MPSVASGPNGNIPSNILFAIAKGAIKNHSLIYKFGHNPDCAAATEEDIWVVGGTYTFPSDSGEALDVVSSSASDTACQITVYGLDENFLEKSETVTVTGTTPVALSGLWTRVNRAYISNDTECVGNVDVTNDANTVVYARVRPEEQQTSQVIYTVPADCTLYVHTWRASSNKANTTGAADMNFLVRFFGGVFREQNHSGLQTAGASYWQQDGDMLVVPSKADIKVSTTATASGTDIGSSFSAICVENIELR